ncbi:DUF2339 domain-containing protein [Bradyrhizobium sp. LHD-71]|uniref:DUF2339 domain-containing protein n=1 Tax=Bradyrhizobium sp. LHD-71 TaxID=3072141 RepID=UPI00280FE65D|nr:DUF2339 domain-containing protein [Bradyrhizobium sp. LHD-71]MDQ8730810.1 DUF2339 domain-containing protein [Bradyrhizobium sp. LHD-71]
MFEILVAGIAIAALIFSRKALNRLRAAEARIAALEAASPPERTTAAAPAVEQPLAPTIVPDVPAEPAAQTPTETPAESAAPPSEAPAVPEAATTPAASPGLEERLGTRWVVWVGGLTLALGGLFLVRYSIEAGLLGPGARIFLGGLFAAALLAAGEWTRRKESISQIAPLPIANIPVILTAAGTAVAFGTVFAAYALYDFLSPAVAFLALGAVALATLAAALLHGPALAGLGVVGAFVTPVLVSSDKPDFWALYIYVAVVTAAAFGLARVRMWRWLAITTIVLGVIWSLVAMGVPGLLSPHAFSVMAGFALAAALVVSGLLFGPEAEPGKIEPISSAALGAYLFAATVMVVAYQHTDPAMVVFAILIAAVIAIAWRTDAAAGALPAAAIFAGLVFLSWAVRGNPEWLVVPGGAMQGVGPEALEGSVAAHLTAALVFAAGFGLAGFLAQGRSSNATVPVIWSAVAVATPLWLLIATYARIAHLDRSIPFAIVAVLLAAAFAYATEQLSRREQRPGQAIAAALFATGTLSALALAFTFALDKGWLTIALALMSLGTAWISLRRPVPFLRWLAAILSVIVVARIGYEPRIAGDDIGTLPIFNWLLYGYGIPALSFWAGSYYLRRRGDDAPLRMVEAAAILFTVLLVFMEIRHFVNGGDVYRADAGLIEVALQVCTMLAMAIGLERLRLRTGSIIHNIGSLVVAAIAGLFIVFGLFLLEMPMLWPNDVGGLVWNKLLLGYALPAVLLLALSYTVAGRRPAAYANTLAGLALVLALTYVTLQIRRFFHGPVLHGGVTTDAEQYVYSLAWLAFGVVLLTVGLIFASQRARLASAVVIGLTVLKAFLFDMSNLTGVYRALSFMGLGLVLVAIGWLYQRILFKRTAPQQVAAE